MTAKPTPKWVQARQNLQKQIEEPLVFVGLPGADGIVNGLLPNGEVYGWYKRRGNKDISSRRRKA